jgi:hypothetical protein
MCLAKFPWEVYTLLSNITSETVKLSNASIKIFTENMIKWNIGTFIFHFNFSHTEPKS